MTKKRAYFPLLTRNDGFIYAFGGKDGSGTTTHRLDRYEVSDDKWVFYDIMPVGTLGFASGVVLENEFWIIGGKRY